MNRLKCAKCGIVSRMSIRHILCVDCCEKRISELNRALAKQNEEICQILGAALGYPKYSDDRINFPDMPLDDPSVCVGDHVAESIAAEAAEWIKERVDNADNLSEVQP